MNIGDIIGVAFTLVIVGIVWAVVAMNKSRTAATSNLWQQLAEQLGGTYVPPNGAFGSHQIRVTHPFTEVLLEVKLMSAVNVTSSPYHQDRALGGTFTHVKATYAGDGVEWRMTQAEAVQHPSFQSLPVAALPANAEIISYARDVMIVMNGHVSDFGVLQSATHIVTEIARHATTQNAPEQAPAV